jgi:hypothetical protein
MDYEFGMSAIEKMSRSFRDNRTDFKRTLEGVTGQPFNLLLKRFARAVLYSDFGLKEDTVYLNEIAKTRFLLCQDGFYLLDGYGNTKNIGKTASTDWIGSWEDARSRFDEPSVAGDNTWPSDVSGLATDFIKITPDERLSEIPEISVRHKGNGDSLEVQIFVYTKGGSTIQSETGPIERLHSKKLGLPELLRKNRLGIIDVEKIMILVTNTDPKAVAPYELFLQE